MPKLVDNACLWRNKQDHFRQLPQGATLCHHQEHVQRASDLWIWITPFCGKSRSLGLLFLSNTSDFFTEWMSVVVVSVARIGGVPGPSPPPPQHWPVHPGWGSHRLPVLLTGDGRTTWQARCDMRPSHNADQKVFASNHKDSFSSRCADTSQKNHFSFLCRKGKCKRWEHPSQKHLLFWMSRKRKVNILLSIRQLFIWHPGENQTFFCSVEQCLLYIWCSSALFLAVRRESCQKCSTLLCLGWVRPLNVPCVISSKLLLFNA